VLALLPESLDGLTILEIGVGEGLWGFLLRTQRRGSFRLIGVEPFRKHIEDLGQLPVYSELHAEKAQRYLADAPNVSADIILLLEVIEHETRENGLELLGQLERRVAPDGLIVVSTPDGFSEGAEGYAGNELNRHLCGFKATDFTSRGYTVRRIRKDVNWGLVVNVLASAWYTIRRGRRPVTHGIVAWRHF
jgi:2-polyprenyl-3-methyl-5-hydroxy-6-metoxy-1,4-benzoquinol methylase